MKLGRTWVEYSCLSEDRTQRGHLKPHAYLEIKWNCEGHFVDALKVIGVGYGWVCTDPSRPDWQKQSVSVHPHIAQVVPAHGLFEENEKQGAGDSHVSRGVEVMSFGLSSARTSRKHHFHIYINSPMQACVLMVCFLHFCPIWFFKHQD